jgi:hypothetical protein
MAKVTIGGKEYLIGELNFIALRKSWSAIDAFMEADSVNPIKGAEVSLKIIAAAVQEEEYFKREDFGIAADLILKPSEVDEIQAALETLSSLVTLMGSSPNLSQPESKVEVGTE